MHALRQFEANDGAPALRRLSIGSVAVPTPRDAAAPVSTPLRPPRINSLAAAFVILFHALLIFALIAVDVVPVRKAKVSPTVVKLIELPSEPPPAASPPADIVPVQQVAPSIIAPPPIVSTPPVAPPPVVTAPAPPPVKAAVIAPPAPAAPPAPSGPVSAPDLATSMISASPPKYPIESRRKREQGTVVLNVLVGVDGAVETVTISRSSGFDRLDKAALSAVRRWRWSPLVRGGQPLKVRGFVDIPFVLQG